MHRSPSHTIVCDQADTIEPDDRRPMSLVEHIQQFIIGTLKLVLAWTCMLWVWAMLIALCGKYLFLVDNELLVKLALFPGSLWVFAKYGQIRDLRSGPEQTVTSDFVKFSPVAISLVMVLYIAGHAGIAAYNVQAVQCSVDNTTAECQQLAQAEDRLDTLKYRLTHLP